jgi:hypothetical protein
MTIRLSFLGRSTHKDSRKFYYIFLFLYKFVMILEIWIHNTIWKEFKNELKFETGRWAESNPKQ